MRGYIERANVVSGQALNVNGRTVISKELPMGEGWYAMRLRINQVLTVGTGSGAVAEGELRFIRGILLRTDRGELLCNLPARALYKIGAYKAGSPPRKDAIAAADGTYRVNVPIFFADFKMDRPEDTILDTKRYNSVTLEIQLGTVADLLTTVGTSAVTATVDVEIERSLGRLPKEAEPFYHVYYDFRPPVDASVNTIIDFERSADMGLKRVYTHASLSGTAGLPFSGANADDVQNVVTIKDQNRFIEKDRVHEMIQEQNKDDAGLETALAGIEVFDFVRDGSIQSMLATGDKSVLQYSWTNKAGVAANDIVTLAVEAARTLK